MSKKRVSSVNKSETSLKDNNSEDSSEKEKQELRIQINKIKALISQVEGTLDITKFGDIDKTSEKFLATTVDYRASKKLVDTNVIFKTEIQKYTGFYCSKATKTEYVIHYEPYDKSGGKENFSLQILNKDGKGSLGNWIMPMLSINIDRILSETPLDDLSMVIPFLKNWKLYIDCYVQRKKQFQELKDSVSTASNCTIDSNLSFTGITLSLFGVHNNAKDSYFDLTIYLAYKPNETRPYKIDTDWSLKKCSPKNENELKAYAKSLKNHSLIEGFRLMMEGKHPVFWWTTEEHDDSPLELNNSSDSDEESFMDRVKSNRKKSLRKRQKRRESKERSKRMKATKKKATTQRKVVGGEENEDSSNEARLSSQNPENPLVSSPQLPKRNEPENTIEDLVEKRKRVLRQTTISLRDNKIRTNYSTVAEVHEISEANDKKSAKSKNPKSIDKNEKKSTPVKKITPSAGILSSKKKDRRKMNRVVTSTPLVKKIASKVKFVPMNDVELSPNVSAVENDDES